MNLNLNLYPKQKEIFDAWKAGAKRIAVAAGRQTGKTFLALTVCMIAMMKGHVVRLFWIARSHNQAKDAFRRMKKMFDLFPDGYYKAVNSPPYKITLRNGCYIEFSSFKDPDSARGFTNINGVVIDEAAFIKEEVWTTVRPIIAKTQGWTMFISSPNQPGDWFHRQFQSAEESFHLTSYDNPYFPDEEIERERRTMRTIDFQREYLAEFVQSEGAMVRQEWLQSARIRRKEEKEYVVLEDGKEIEMNKLAIYIGGDTAISTSTDADWTAFVVIGVTPNNNCVVLDARRGHWTLNEQLEELDYLYDEWMPRRLAIEHANAGIALIQEIHRTKDWYRKVEEIKPKKSKQERFVRTAMGYEKGMVYHLNGLPAWFEADILSFTGTNDDVTDDVPDALAHGYNLGMPDRDRLKRSRIGTAIDFI